MKTRVFFAFLALLILHVISPAGARPDRLRLLTVNVWSGLDYRGFFQFGEYEPAARREARYQSLKEQIRSLNPDVIFLQEANPVGEYASRLAEALSYDEIHIVSNGGIKVGSFGLPVNFREGIAILARHSLSLGKVAAWKLSGPPGIYGDIFTIHFGEATFSLVGKITVKNAPLYLVNVHLSSGPPPDPLLEKQFADLRARGAVTPEEYEYALELHQRDSKRREREVACLLEIVASLPAGIPAVVAGDFNAMPDSPEVRNFERAGGFLDTCRAEGEASGNSGKGQGYTWDPAKNRNTAFSTRMTDARGRRLDGYGILGALWDAIPRRIDYIFLNRRFPTEDGIRCRIVLDSPANGIEASDHYGVLSEVCLRNTSR